MATILFKEFSEIAINSAKKKTRLIRKEKNKPEYSPKTDFYKGLRERIQKMHKDNLPINTLDEAIKNSNSRTRKEHYKILIESYAEWLDGKTINFFNPPRDKFEYSLTEVIVNPELGLNINNISYNIKLYFNKDDLNKTKANYMLVIMDSLWDQQKNAILDVRNKKLLTFDGNYDQYMKAVFNEIMEIEKIWTEI